MPLTVGSRLGSYEITALLGKGGMGEVWRARDARLKRSVAVKVLPDEFARDPERLIRFQREAESLAALNHANIASIYDLQEAEGIRFLVLELVEGPTLEERIHGGPIPLDESLRIAKQIAEGLEAAHDRGVVHRDLKPANVKIAEGVVKILDFGLAKASQDTAAAANLSQSPTMMSTSMPGVILGTAAYMSPEQAKGKTTDRQTDIWAFGCVLYEMLAGTRAFDGETLGEIMGSVFKSDPAWARLPADTPAGVRRLLRRCLEKDPHRRLHDIADARLEIEEAVANPVEIPQGRSKTGVRWPAIVAVALVSLALGAAGTAFWLRANRPVDREPRAMQIESGAGILSPQIAPNGQAVVYVRGGRLMVRPLGGFEAREIAGTEGASNPFWSPDSASIGYFVNQQLRAVSAKGGTSRVLADDVFAPLGGAWCQRGLVFVRWNRGLWLVPDGGQATPFAELNTSDPRANLSFPSCLPDGRVLAVRRNDTAGTAQSIVVIGGGKETVLLQLPSVELQSVLFVPPDSVIFQRGWTEGIWRLPVSADLSSAAGPPSAILAGGLVPSVSADGQLVAVLGVRITERQLYWVDRTGRRLSPFGKPQPAFAFEDVVVSPDGNRVAATGQGTSVGSEIWIHREATVQRFTTNTTDNQGPAWSPSGDRLAYVGRNSPDGEFQLFARSTAGDADAQPLVKTQARTPSWTPDGRSMVYSADGASWLISVAEAAKPKLLIKGATYPVVSPDGRMLAFTAATSGRPEVYVTTFPVPGEVWPVSEDRGRYPRWNPQGGELFFAGGPLVADDPNSARDLFVVEIDTRTPGRIGRPERLFDAEAQGLSLSSRSFPSYDVSPDGTRIITPISGVEGTPIISLIDDVRAWIRRR